MSINKPTLQQWKDALYVAAEEVFSLQFPTNMSLLCALDDGETIEDFRVNWIMDKVNSWMKDAILEAE